MKTLNKLFVSALMLLAAVPTFAQEDGETKSEFTLDGEVRPRTEVNHGNGNMGLMANEVMPGYSAKGNYATSQRTRLNFQYNKTNKYKFRVSLQDVRVWGSQSQLVKNEDLATSVHEAWGQVYFTDEISLKAGRMELVYDDARIFGNVGWAQQARSHDLAMFKYEGVVKADLGFGYHGAPFTGADMYNNMQFAHVSNYTNKEYKKVDDGLDWNILILNKGAAEYQIHHDFATPLDENTAYTQTMGTHLQYKTGALHLSLNAYYQMGKNAANWIDLDSLVAPATEATLTAAGLKGEGHNGQELGAYNFSVQAMYGVMDGLKVGAGVELLSGNSYNDDVTEGTYLQDGEVQQAFTPFFGTNHKFNGWMDYFYVGNHGGNVGLTDIYGKFVYKANSFTFTLMPHFYLPGGKSGYNFVAEDGTITQKDLGALGTEIDFSVGYKVNGIATIKCGASYMMATEGLHAVKDGNFTYNEGTEYGQNYWAWTMLVLKPKFLNKL